MLLLLTGPATAQGQRVLLIDRSPRSVDPAMRRQVMTGLQNALESINHPVTVHHPPRPESSASIQALLDRARQASEQFQEQEALRLLNSAERAFTSGFGARPGIALLIRILLTRARLHADLGHRPETERDLNRAVVLNPELTLDPGVHPPGLIQLFKQLKPAVTSHTGTLNLITTPPGIPLWVDGRPRGTAQLQLALPAGQHFVAAGQRGAMTGRGITITAGQTLPIHLEMRRPTLTDQRLRNLGLQADATWVVVLKLVPRTTNHQIRLRVLASRVTDLPRTLQSPVVQTDHLTWATSQVAVQLQGLLQGATPGPVAIGSSTADGGGSVLKSWWFWTLVVAVVGGGTATAIVLTRDSDPGVRVTLER